MPPPVTNDQISQYLADPLSFPPEFKNWVVRYLEQHQPDLLIRQLSGTLLPSKIAGYPGNAGKVLAGDGTWADMAGYTLAYTEFTSAVSITATVEASANTVVTASAVTFDGATAIRVSFYSPAIVTPPVASSSLYAILFDGSTNLGQLALHIRSTDASANSGLTEMNASRRLTPSAGSHTYSVRAIVSSGTGSVSAQGGGAAGTQMPGYIWVTKA